MVRVPEGRHTALGRHPCAGESNDPLTVVSQVRREVGQQIPPTSALLLGLFDHLDNSAEYVEYRPRRYRPVGFSALGKRCSKSDTVLLEDERLRMRVTTSN
jgi:hypothetical protein